MLDPRWPDRRPGSERCPQPPVGAGWPAMVVNDNAGCLNERGAQPFFASRLAPTIDRVHL
ncbi:hypothetical protein CGA21_25295 [Pseudomonas sp. PSB11]|nr:hypothetical protein [Pseudomonas sp. PSB11]